jgi:hypothetical protein
MIDKDVPSAVNNTESSAQPSSSFSHVTPTDEVIPDAVNNTSTTTYQEKPSCTIRKLFEKNVFSSSVSKSFSLLKVPEVQPKKKVNTIREKLPKALSGTKALKMMQEREDTKRAKEEAKRKRKEEREIKKKEREEEKLQKKKIREEKRLKKEEERKVLKMNNRKRQLSSSSSESNSDIPTYADTDDDFDERSQCPGCATEDGDTDEWIKCTSCPRRWHISCTGEPMLFELPLEHVKNFPFVCEFCVRFEN